MSKYKKKLFSLLPLKMREKIFLRYIEPFSYDEFNENYTIKVAETTDEVLQAYQLVYQNYFQTGLCDLESENIRITKHALLPTTSIIIVKYKEEVVGTISLITDNPLGLPMEKLFSIDELRKTGKQIAEISTLSIKKGHRRQRGKIMLPLTNYLFDYARNILGMDYFTLIVHPYSAPFYTSLFAAKFITKKIKKYSGAKDALASALVIPLANSDEILKSIYVGKKLEHRFYDIFNRKNFTCFQYPERKYYRAFDPGFKLGLLKEVFAKSINSLKELDEWDKEILQKLFSFKEYDNLFKKNYQNMRSSPRFSVNCSGLYTDDSSELTHFIRVYNVSNQGLLFHFVGDVPELSEEGSLVLKISKDQTVTLKVKILRMHNQQYGAKILAMNSQNTWFKFIDYLAKSLTESENNINDYNNVLVNIS